MTSSRRLRIVYAAGSSPDAPGLPASRIWRRNLLGTLLEMGAEVHVVDADLDPLFVAAEDEDSLRILRPALTGALRRTYADARKNGAVDVVFTYFYRGFVDVEALDEMRRDGAATINFSCNNIHQFHLVRDIAPHFTMCMIPEPEAMERFRAAGAHPLHLPMAANPAVYKPYPVVPQFDATFVGQQYADRSAHVLHLLRNGIDVRVWGNGWAPSGGWRRVRRLAALALDGVGLRRGSADDALLRRASRPPLADDQMVRMFSRSRISLGFGVVGDTHLGVPQYQVRLRDFEAPMSGALYLAQHLNELADYYELGREIETFRDDAELLEKVRHYLRHPDEAQAMRIAGRKRALRDHTWRARFESLFRELGLL